MKNKFNFLEFFQSLKPTLLVTILLFTCVSVWGTADVTYVFADASDNPGSGEEWNSADIDEFSSWNATTGGSNAPKYYSTGSGLRVYNGGTFTISSSKTIAAISLKFSGDSYTFTLGTKTPIVVNPDATSYQWSVSQTCRLQQIEITYGSSCTAPTVPTNGATTTSSQVVSWTSDASAWDVYHSTTNTAPSTQTTATGLSSKSYTFTGLTPSTKYYWWVRTSCDETSKSSWVAGAAFTTNAITYTDYITMCAPETQCAAPTFSPVAGTFNTGTQNITLATTTDGATIYYTTDGSDPTESGTKQAYSSAIPVSQNCTIKAYAAKKDMTDSEVSSAEYTINYTVIFNMQSHGQQINDQYISYNGLVTKPADPSAIGYDFGGWYKEGTCDNAWDFANVKITENNTTLYAKWTPKMLTITWSANGSTSQTQVQEGSAVTLPAAPSDLGTYKFKGWTTQKDYQHATDAPSYISSSTVPEQATTYYAVYAEDVDGKSTTDFQRVTALSDLDNAAKIVIVDYSTNYALTTSLSASSALTESQGKITNVDAANQWSLTKVTNGWEIKDGDNKLGSAALPTSSSKTKAIAKSSTQANSVWEIVVNTNQGSTNAFSISNALTNHDSGLEYYSGWKLYYSSNYQTSATFDLKLYIPATIKVPGNFTTKVVTPKSLSVKKAPTTVDYKVGDTFDPTGVELTVTYQDDSSEDITTGFTYEANNLDTDKKLTASSNKVTFDFKGVKTDQTITVGTLDKLEITNEPTTKKYVVGEYFNPAGMKVKAVFTNDVEIADLTGYTMNPTTSTALTADNEKVTISYTHAGTEKSVDQEISVGTLSSIAVTKDPTKTEYTEGEKFSTTGMEVTGTYSNGATRPITNYTYEPTSNLQLGQTKITIKVGEISTTYDITIKEAEKWTVTFDMNGTKEEKKVIKGWTLNEIPTPTAISGFTFQGWVKTAISGETASQPTYDLLKTATSFTPNKDTCFYAVYSREDEVVVNGFKLSTTYNDVTRYVGTFNSSYFDTAIVIGHAEIFFFDEKDQIYSYSGNSKKYYTISSSGSGVSSYNSKPTTSSFSITEENNLFKFANGSRYLGYNAQSPRYASYTNSDARAQFTKIPASKSVITNLYSTTAMLPELQSIKITTHATKDTYFEGDDFEKAGMVVTATFSNGAKVLADNAYTIAPSTNLQTSDKKVVVSYTYGTVTKTDDQDITVNAIELTKIELNTDNVQKTFMQNAEFNSTGLVVNAFFNDDRKDKQLADGYTVSTPDMTTTGEKTVTVSYTYKEGNTKTADYTIQVNSALTKITLNTDNVKKTYIETETFDPANLVVTATYGAGEPKAVTENITYYLGDDQITDATILAGLNTLAASTVKTITVKYTEFGTTVSNTYDVTVNPYPRYSVTFMEKGAQKGEILTETQGQGGVTAPTATETIGEYTFVGWSATNPETETTVKPELVTLTSGKYYPTENITLYAIYSVSKEADFQGFTLNMKVGSTTYYVGGFSNKEFTNTQVAASAMTLWYSDGYLFYKNGETTTYVYGSGNDLKTTTAKKDISTLWSTTTVGDSIYFHYSTRWIAWNGQQSTNYWRSYAQSSNGQHLFKQSAGEVGRFVVPNYTTMPDTRLIPNIKFTTATVNTNVLTDASDHTSLATYTNNTLSTENTEGTKTFALADGDDAVASINASTGEVTAKKAGTVTVTVTIASTSEWYEGSASYSLTFNKMNPTIQFVDVTDSKATIYTGAANKVTFTATHNSDATNINYESSNSSYATIASTGETEGKAAGSCTLYAGLAATDLFNAVTGNSRAKVTLTVKSNAKTQTLKFDKASYEIPNGSSPAPFTNILTGAKTKVNYESNNKSLATVDANGLVTIVSTENAGTATITATAQAGNVVEDDVTYAYSASAPVSYTISVNYPKPTISVASCDIKAPISVELSAPEAYAIIYTDNGSTPSYEPYNGTEYTKALTIDKTTTIKAIALSDNFEESPVAEATYTKVTPQVNCNVEDEGSVPAGKGAITLTADDDVLVTYILYNANDVEVASAYNVKSPVSIDITMGNYTLMYSGKWSCKDGFENEGEEITFTATGAGHLPIQTNLNKDDGTPAYFSKSSGVALYSISETTNPNCGVGLTTEKATATIQFAEKPDKLSYYARLNGTGSDYEMVVQESSDGEHYETIMTHNSSKNPLSTYQSKPAGDLFTCDLSDGTRFVQWTMTVKATGTNVVFGNITITAANDGDITIDGVNVTEIPSGFQGNVTIANGGSVESTNKLTINNFTIEAGGELAAYNDVNVTGNLVIKSELGDLSHPAKSGQMEYLGEMNVSGDAFFEVKIDPSGVASAGWYAVAVPFEVAINGGVYGKLEGKDWAALTNEKDFAVMQYQGDVRATGAYGWIKVHKTGATTLKPGVFYLVTVADTDFGTLRFKKAAGAALNNKAEITINEYAVTSSGAANKDNGWNGVANNGLTYADLTFGGEEEKVQVYYHTSNSFDPLDIEDYTFVVASPFFVQSPKDGDQLEFSTPTIPGELRAPMRETTSGEFNVRLGKNTDSYVDQLYLSATEDATATYQIGHDMVKSFMNDAPKVAQMYINGYGQKLCDAEFQLNGDEAEFPLTITAPQAGEYQLYVNRAMTGATLYLYENGNLIWNLSQGAYTLDLSKGTNDDYTLVLKADGRGIGTGAAGIDADNDGVQKFILDERLVIIRDGKMYNAEGALVK